MKTIAILSQKGGAGKTTLAINLAVSAEIAKKQAVIIDLDPQSSSTSWADSRQSETPHVISAQAARLPNLLEAAKTGGADVVFIDTSPHSENSSLTAARFADFVLIPCRPAILDLKAISNTIDIARLAGKQFAVVLTCVPARGNLATEASEAVSVYGVTVCPTYIGQRAAFVHSITLGQSVHEYEPKGKAVDEINKLYKWIVKKVK